MKGRALKILVADDNPDLRKVITAMLSAEGYFADECRDGINPLALYHFHEHDLLVLGDANYRGSNIIARLRGDGDRRPIILLSSNPNDMEALAASRRENVTVLSKPFERRELLAAVLSATALVP